MTLDHIAASSLFANCAKITEIAPKEDLTSIYERKSTFACHFESNEKSPAGSD
jgi:hypothetical protein